jgi:CBS domain-containing protein/ribosome-associated translation inhibitor RaiA
LSAKLDFVMGAPPWLDAEDSVVDAATAMMASGYRGVPVTSEGGEYVGFISRTDIIRNIPHMEELEGITVNEILTPWPMTIGVHETLKEARSMMKGLDVKTLPVVDTQGILVGMIGIGDIIKKTQKPTSHETLGEVSGLSDSAAENLEVRTLMVEKPITASPEETLTDAARKMADHDVSTLVVLDADEIVGIISQIDLIELIASYQEVDQAYVQITGLEADSWTFDAMHDSIHKYLKRFGQVVSPRIMDVHVVPHKQEGQQTKYSLKLRLQTDKAMFYARNHDWNIIAALDGAFETMWRHIKKEKEKHLEVVKEASRAR